MPRTLTERKELKELGSPEKYAGYGLCDPEGNRIGKVVEIFANGDRVPEYVRVSLGFLGTKSALIPVQTVTVDGERRRLVLE